jgi:pSer/pThr/pTyr-binding forkhead associated (FHA) protein
MVQFKILSGKKAGTTYVALRFPVRIGRLPGSELQSEEDGVWDQHAQLVLNPAHDFVFSACPGALVTVNGQPVQQAILRNGDEISLASLKLQFWLSETRQTGLRFREGLTWVAIALISLAQVALIYRLLR